MKPNPRAGLIKHPASAIPRPRVVARKRRRSAPVASVVAGLIGAFAVAIGGVYLYEIGERSQATQETAQTSPPAEEASSASANSAPEQEPVSTANAPDIAAKEAANATPLQAESAPAPSTTEEPKA